MCSDHDAFSLGGPNHLKRPTARSTADADASSQLSDSRSLNPPGAALPCGAHARESVREESAISLQGLLDFLHTAPQFPVTFFLMFQSPGATGSALSALLRLEEAARENGLLLTALVDGGTLVIRVRPAPDNRPGGRHGPC